MSKNLSTWFMNDPLASIIYIAIQEKGGIYTAPPCTVKK